MVDYEDIKVPKMLGTEMQPCPRFSIDLYIHTY